MERSLFRSPTPMRRTQAHKPAVKHGDSRKKRILLIDDNDDTLYLMRDMLERSGYDVDLADSGAEGILRFRRATPDLVLLDIEMPGMDGFEVCRRIQEQDPSNRWHRGWRTTTYRRMTATHVPVVLLTGHASLDYVREAALVGIDGYIVKSRKEQELVERIRHFLNSDEDEKKLSDGEIESYVKNATRPKTAEIKEGAFKPPAHPAADADGSSASDAKPEGTVKTAAATQTLPEHRSGPRFPRGSGLVESHSIATVEETELEAESPGEGEEPVERKSDELRGWLIQMFNAPDAAEAEIVDPDVEYDRIMSSPTAIKEPVTAKIREMTHRFGQRVTSLLGVASVPGECRIRVLEGGLRVELDIEPPTGMGEVVTIKKVKQMLEDERIIYGIDEDAITGAVEAGKSRRVSGTCIARGIPPEEGEDGKIIPIQNGVPSVAAS